MEPGKYATNWRTDVQCSGGFIAETRSFIRGIIIDAFAIASNAQEEYFLKCLFCHHVYDDQRDDFLRLVLRLNELGQFINTDTCVQMLKGERVIDGQYFHLSFDDGFKNLFSNAFSILKKLNIPATFFVPTAVIGANWEKTKQYCEQSLGCSAVSEMLSWSDIKEMASTGYEIGSHTRTHARLKEISYDLSLLEDEIAESKYEIEKHIETKCNFISWPYGRRSDVDDEALKMIRKAGYRACFGGYRGTVIPQQTDIFRIPRHHFEVHWPLAHVMYFVAGKKT